jgi:hypothetical protein
VVHVAAIIGCTTMDMGKHYCTINVFQFIHFVWMQTSNHKSTVVVALKLIFQRFHSKYTVAICARCWAKII